MVPTQRLQGILENLLEQLQSGHLCDVLFYSNSDSIWAHSCVLEGFSPFFSTLFSTRLQRGHHWSIKQPIQISISNVTQLKSQSNNNCMNCLAQVVKYIYTGAIKPTLLHLNHLLILGNRLKNKELLDICDNFRQGHSLLEVPLFESSNEVEATESGDSHIKPTSASQMRENSNFEPESNLETSTIDQSKLLDSEPQNCSLKSENYMECAVCRFVSEDPDMMSKHLKVFHNSAYRCLYCDFSHKNVVMLVEHIETQCSSQEKTVCSVCLFKGSNVLALMSHVKTHINAKPFTCSTCKRGFDRRSLWLKHRRSHVFKKSFACTSCSLKFDRDEERQKHFRLSHAPKKHVCDECGFSTPFASTLATHKMKHRNKAFSCKFEECKFQTSSEIMLLRHRAVHKSISSEKSMKSTECSVCTMKFTLTKNLIRHMKTHNSKQWKLKCQLCSYETFRSDKYKEHLAFKHPVQENMSAGRKSCSGDPLTQQSISEHKITPEPSSSLEKMNTSSSVEEIRDGYKVDSNFPQKHNTLMMNGEGDISIVNSNKKNSVTLRNLGNLTGTITLNERTGVLTMNNINSGSVFLNETTGELTYINLENDKNIDLNCFTKEPSDQVDNYQKRSISNPIQTSEFIKLDEFTGEIIKVSTSNEENIPEQEFDSFDMDINDESFDGFDDFDELLFDVFKDEDDWLVSDVVLEKEASIDARPCMMPHLDESTGLLTFDEPLAPSSTGSQEWRQPSDNRDISGSETYQLLLDEVTGVLHD